MLSLSAPRALVGSGPAVIAEILPEFHPTLLAASVEIADALRHVDLAAVARTAHRFKSATASIRAHTLATACAALEDAAAAPADLDALAVTIKRSSAKADATPFAALDALGRS